MFYFSLALFSCLSCIAMASAPEGFQLISGEAKPPVIGPDGTITISSGKHAIVHWDKFSIGKDTAVKFAQADQTSAILNRVVGSAESRIDGALLSNGKVFLVNQNGVVVGPNGRIDTAGFIASTLDITNDDFLKGKELLFSGDSKQKVVNLGMIVANEGDIVLIGQCVDNQGTLNAPHGHVLLGCGQAVLLQPSGEERMFIRIPASEPASLEHSGTIEALVAEMKSGVTPFAKAIKSSGRIDALATVEENGKVFLVAEEGRVDVSGSITARGGNIQLLGKEVYLLDGADIEASGNKAGGQILVGGDYQGNNPNIPNADISYVAKSAMLRANANGEGDGGKVIIWAEKATGFFGHIEARGGAEKGNGGLIEVSADSLTFEGFADTRAPKGNVGTLLLDPTDIVISAGADTCPVTCWSGGTYNPNCTSPNIINTTTLDGMQTASNVIINTSSACGDAGSITINDPYTTGATNNITLNATTDIIFNETFGMNSSANIFLNAGGNVQINNPAFLETTSGNISINAVGNVIVNYTLETDSGDIDITAGGELQVNGINGFINTNSGGSLNFNVGSLAITDAQVNVSSSPGTITATIANDCSIIATSSFSAILSIGGPCTVTIGGNLTIDGGSSAAEIVSDGGDLLVIVGGKASLTNFSALSTQFYLGSGNDCTLVVDNNNPSPPNIGSQNPMLIVDGSSAIFASSGHTTRIFTATRAQNLIDPSATFGNTHSNFTPGPLYVDSATEIWSTYYPSSAGGTPYTFFYKDPVSVPPSPPPAPASSTAAAAAVSSNTVANTAVTNLITTQQNSLSLITTPVPPSGGQAIPLTTNANESALNNTMSGAICP